MVTSAKLLTGLLAFFFNLIDINEVVSTSCPTDTSLAVSGCARSEWLSPRLTLPSCHSGASQVPVSIIIPPISARNKWFSCCFLTARSSCCQISHETKIYTLGLEVEEWKFLKLQCLFDQNLKLLTWFLSSAKLLLFFSFFLNSLTFFFQLYVACNATEWNVCCCAVMWTPSWADSPRRGSFIR